MKNKTVIINICICLAFALGIGTLLLLQPRENAQGEGLSFQESVERNSAELMHTITGDTEEEAEAAEALQATEAAKTQEEAEAPKEPAEAQEEAETPKEPAEAQNSEEDASELPQTMADGEENASAAKEPANEEGSDLRGANAISNTEEFLAFAKSVSEDGKNYEGETVTLLADIDLTGAEFSPIGLGADGEITAFWGILDGQGHSILGMNLSGDGPEGLFYDLNGSIFNLTIAECEIRFSQFGGAFAAILDSNGALINCMSGASVYPTDYDSDLYGGLAGIARGSIINCAMMHERNNDSADTLAGKEEGASVVNSYTSARSRFKLSCNGTDESNELLRSNAVANLNNALASLALQYLDIRFHNWLLTDELPYLALETEENDSVTAVTVAAGGKTLEAAYDFEQHMWTLPEDALDSLKGSEVTCRTSLGSEFRFSVDGDFQQINFQHSGVTNLLSCRQLAVSDLKASEDEVTLDLSALDSSCPKEADTIVIGYYAEDGSCSGQDRVVCLASKGTYRLTGTLEGYLYTDVSDYGREGLNLIFDGVHITSLQMPAISIANEEKDARNPGVNVFLADGSDNSLYGGYYFNIYSRKDKSEGAFSAKCNLAFCGDSGKLSVGGTLENIETAGELSFCGGNYVLTSSDDSISGSYSVRVTDGTFELIGADGCFDYDNVFISGGLITGSSATVLKKVVDQHVRLSGGTIAYTGRALKLEEGSTQGFISLVWDEELERALTESGASLLILDDNDSPVLALDPCEGFRMGGFSVPKMESKSFHVCLADGLEGKQTYNVFTEITGYHILAELKADGNSSFRSQGLLSEVTLSLEEETK